MQYKNNFTLFCTAKKAKWNIDELQIFSSMLFISTQPKQLIFPYVVEYKCVMYVHIANKNQLSLKHYEVN